MEAEVEAGEENTTTAMVVTMAAEATGVTWTDMEIA